MHPHINGRFRQAGGLRHLLGVGQAADQIAGLDLHSGPQTKRRFLTCGHVLSGVDHVLILCAAKLQAVAVVQLQQRREPGEAPLHPCDLAQRYPQMVHPLWINHRRVLRAHGVAAHEITAVEDLTEALHLLRVGLHKAPRVHTINSLAVAVCHHGHVFGPLETPLQLNGNGSRLGQRGKIVPHAYIPRAEPRSGLAAIGIRQSAGLGAPAAIAAALTQHGGEKALAADGYTLCAMPEHLDLDALVCGTPDRRKVALPGQHGAGEAALSHEAHAAGVMQSHLGAGMSGQVRESGAKQVGHTHILHQHAVHPEVIEQLQHVFDCAHFTVLHERINGDMDAHVMQVAIPHRLAQLLLVEVSRARPCAERRVSQIHRVRPRRNAPLQRLHAPRRSQILHQKTS